VHVAERGGDRLRLRQVKSQASGQAADLAGHRVGVCRGAAGDEDGVGRATARPSPLLPPTTIEVVM
jgi:hypothetical protein